MIIGPYSESKESDPCRSSDSRILAILSPISSSALPATWSSSSPSFVFELEAAVDLAVFSAER